MLHEVYVSRCPRLTVLFVSFTEEAIETSPESKPSVHTYDVASSPLADSAEGVIWTGAAAITRRKAILTAEIHCATSYGVMTSS